MDRHPVSRDGDTGGALRPVGAVAVRRRGDRRVGLRRGRTADRRLVPPHRGRARAAGRRAGVCRGWTRSQLVAAAIFGVATALMNTFFYLAIDRIDLGKGVAIEFLGPIAVAAAMTRTSRNAAALVLTIGGVATLGGVEIGDNALGVVFVLAASAMWATYIVVGSRIAQIGRGLAPLAVGLSIGAARADPDRCAVERAGVGVADASRAVSAHWRVLERDRVRHRSVRPASHPDPPILVAARAAAGHRARRRLGRARPATLGRRSGRHLARARRSRDSRSATRSSASSSQAERQPALRPTSCDRR